MKVWKNKRIIKKKTTEELAKERLQEITRKEAINKTLENVGIVAGDIKKLMLCLLYKFRRNNIYYNLLVSIYLEDNTKEDFFNTCYIVAMSAEDKTDFKSAYKELKNMLETETATNRRQKQKQVFKTISFEELEEMPSNSHELLDVANAIDTAKVWQYINKHCTTKQVQALKKYVYNNEKIDTKQKRRITRSLETSDFRELLK